MPLSKLFQRRSLKDKKENAKESKVKNVLDEKNDSVAKKNAEEPLKVDEEIPAIHDKILSGEANSKHHEIQFLNNSEIGNELTVPKDNVNLEDACPNSDPSEESEIENGKKTKQETDFQKENKNPEADHQTVLISEKKQSDEDKIEVKDIEQEREESYQSAEPHEESEINLESKVKEHSEETLQENIEIDQHKANEILQEFSMQNQILQDSIEEPLQHETNKELQVKDPKIEIEENVMNLEESSMKEQSGNTSSEKDDDQENDESSNDSIKHTEIGTGPLHSSNQELAAHYEELAESYVHNSMHDMNRRSTFGAFKSEPKKRIQRKYGSEGEAGNFPLVENDLKYNKKDLENVLKLYANKLISESVVVTNKVDEMGNFDEEVIKDYTNRRLSELSDTNQYRMKNSDSISEGEEICEDQDGIELDKQITDDCMQHYYENISIIACPTNTDTNNDEDEIQGMDKKIQAEISSEAENLPHKNMSEDLIVMSGDEDESQLDKNSKDSENSDTVSADLGDNLPEYQVPEEEKKINWKVGYLHVKLPQKSRGKGNLKVWKKRCVVIQPDEFVNDPKNPCLMINVYNAESVTSRKHSALFWKSVSCQKAVVYRSSSRSHQYAFTIADDNQAVVHLAADSESLSQEWMAAIRAILWPPSPVVQLEKMLNGNEFEISLIDNNFSYHAGLLGTYGYLSITSRKLILLHPQMGYVIQEWYLNTVDNFKLIPQSKDIDSHKVLSMTTCSDSSTGTGEILIYCVEAVGMLQAIATTIHQVLKFHTKKDGSKYQKELQELAEWMTLPVANTKEKPDLPEGYYKVPPRQVKSLLDIPNFIFDKPLPSVASTIETASAALGELPKRPLTTSKTNLSTFSQDSGISINVPSEDFLNCSITSFVIGNGHYPEKSSDSELSDTYSPPCTPDLERKTQETKDSKKIRVAT